MIFQFTDPVHLCVPVYAPVRMDLCGGHVYESMLTILKFWS
jgi:hypothetical protein